MASDVLWLGAVGTEKAGGRLIRKEDILNDQRLVGFLSVVLRGGGAQMESGEVSITAKYRPFTSDCWRGWGLAAKTGCYGYCGSERHCSSVWCSPCPLVSWTSHQVSICHKNQYQVEETTYSWRVCCNLEHKWQLIEKCLLFQPSGPWGSPSL